jgi:hypothetical protein
MPLVLKFATGDDGKPYPYWVDDETETMYSAEPPAQTAPKPTEQTAPIPTSPSSVVEPDYENVIPRAYEAQVADRAERRRNALEDRRAEPQQQETIDAIDRAIQPEKQFATGMVGTALSAPWNIGGILTKIAPLMLDRSAQMDAYAGNKDNPISDYLFNQGASAYRGVSNLFGAEEDPQHPINRAMRTFGSATIPYGKNIAATAAIVGGVNTGADVLSRALEKPSLRSFAKGVPNWLNDALFTPAKGAQPTIGPEGTPIVPSPFDKPTVPVQTVSGPGQISKGEYMTIGGIAAGTMGMIFTPMIYRRFATNRVPQFRPVANAAPGTQSITNLGDLARTYDDVNAGLRRVLRRSGVDVAAAARVEAVLGVQTRGTANALIDAAIKIGRMNTPSYTFNVRVPLQELMARETPATRQYLHILDTWDEIRRNSNAPLSRGTQARINRANAPVRGFDIISVTNARNALERTNPEVIEYARAYRENLRAMRRFEADGEYATLTRGEARRLNAEFPNEVPFRGSPRTNDPNFDRGSPIAALGDRMRDLMRTRMENEARGLYVDTIRNSPTGPTQRQSLFTPVDAERLSQNANWRPNVVRFQRRGVPETYTADPTVAALLRMDPYYITGNAGQIAYSTKRLYEMATTGELAPWFAPTSFVRNWWLGKISPDPGMRSPTMIGSLAAIPEQLYPQFAHAVHNSLERTGAAAWLQNTAGFGGQFVQDLSNRLGYHYTRSFFAQMEAVGGGRGSILTQQIDANNRLTQAIQQATGPVKTLLEGYRSILNSVHNAPSFNYGMRNRNLGIPDYELARRMRGLTGDPRIGGEYYTNVPGRDAPVRIPFEDSRVSHTAIRAVQAYGGATEIGRVASPWFNATMQGVKRVGRAYTDDPVRFTGRVWLYQIAPAASLYMAARALGNDPNGVSYLDYMMNRRPEYSKMMNFYIPIPGKPAEQGIEFPSFHEGSVPRYLATIALDHAFGNAFFTEKEDLLRAAEGISGVVFMPAMPPLANLGLAGAGRMPGMSGPFSGESYVPKREPFDQRGGLGASTEVYMRTLAPALADVYGAGAAAFIQSPDKFSMDALRATLKGIGTRAVQKTPILRDSLDLQQPMTGNNDITEELFRKSKALRTLEQFYKKNTAESATGTQSTIGTRPISKAGEERATELLGPRPPDGAAGINQPAPTNPLYNMFIQELHDAFVKDSPTDRHGNPTGALAIRSLWNRYSIATQQIDRLKKVNPGNDTIWREEITRERPKQMEYLRQNGVDPFNPTQARNFYERKRQDAARVILKTIRDVEADFSKRVGKLIKIEDINPYGKGLDESVEPEAVDASGVLQ